MSPWPILAAFLSLVLAACWVGKPFYPASEIRAPIPAGEYFSVELAKAGAAREKERMRISTDPDGLTRMVPLKKGEDPSVLGFAALDRSGTTYVGWLFVEPGPRKVDDEVAYFLLQRAGRSFRFIMPNCSENRELAVAAGAEIIPDKKAPVCRFADRHSLEAALNAALTRLPPSVELSPVRH